MREIDTQNEKNNQLISAPKQEISRLKDLNKHVEQEKKDALNKLEQIQQIQQQTKVLAQKGYDFAIISQLQKEHAEMQFENEQKRKVIS